MSKLLHLVGPGGAGKSTVGPLLSARLGWEFLDLDVEFMRREGEISAFISQHGYECYARRNVAIYLGLVRRLSDAAVVALSSGFLTYGFDADPDYRKARKFVVEDQLTALLLPAFELEACVATIVERQLRRSYLAGDRAKEEKRIRERFPIFDVLECARFRSDVPPSQLASDIELFARGVIRLSAVS